MAEQPTLINLVNLLLLEAIHNERVTYTLNLLKQNYGSSIELMAFLLNNLLHQNIYSQR